MTRSTLLSDVLEHFLPAGGILIGGARSSIWIAFELSMYCVIIKVLRYRVPVVMHCAVNRSSMLPHEGLGLYMAGMIASSSNLSKSITAFASIGDAEEDLLKPCIGKSVASELFRTSLTVDSLITSSDPFLGLRPSRSCPSGTTRD